MKVDLIIELIVIVIVAGAFQYIGVSDLMITIICGILMYLVQQKNSDNN